MVWLNWQKLFHILFLMSLNIIVIQLSLNIKINICALFVIIDLQLQRITLRTYQTHWKCSSRSCTWWEISIYFKSIFIIASRWLEQHFYAALSWYRCFVHCQYRHQRRTMNTMKTPIFWVWRTILKNIMQIIWKDIYKQLLFYKVFAEFLDRNTHCNFDPDLLKTVINYIWNNSFKTQRYKLVQLLTVEKKMEYLREKESDKVWHWVWTFNVNFVITWRSKHESLTP
jgi:hypothetical protein